MTLIVTVIGNLGILQVSDSNLTSRDSAGLDRPYGTGKKVYELGFCPGAVALAGSYGIQDTPMDSWMPNAISHYAATALPSPHLEGFAHHLAERLAAERAPGEETGHLIHIAGYAYASDARRTHPEMWFVRNYSGIDDATGEYIGLSDTYAVTEDFWTRDYRIGGQIHRHIYGYRYFNGLPEGLQQYFRFSIGFSEFLEGVWANPDWQFRQPRDLSELAVFIDLEFRVVGALFAVSDYRAQYVGGDTQFAKIEAPADAIPL